MTETGPGVFAGATTETGPGVFAGATDYPTADADGPRPRHGTQSRRETGEPDQTWGSQE